jgi:hypothetical protein
MNPQRLRPQTSLGPAQFGAFRQSNGRRWDLSANHRALNGEQREAVKLPEGDVKRGVWDPSGGLNLIA